MTIRSQDASVVQDTIDQAIDAILVMPDEAVRLAAFAYLREHFLRRITKERNQAAYEARLVYSGVDLEQITGCFLADIYRWAMVYANDNRLPAPRTVRRGDISHAITLASGVGVYRRGAVEHGESPVVEE